MKFDKLVEAYMSVLKEDNWVHPDDVHRKSLKVGDTVSINNLFYKETPNRIGTDTRSGVFKKAYTPEGDLSPEGREAGYPENDRDFGKRNHAVIPITGSELQKIKEQGPYYKLISDDILKQGRPSLYELESKNGDTFFVDPNNLHKKSNY
jgi:hypothetical protein